MSDTDTVVDTAVSELLVTNTELIEKIAKNLVRATILMNIKAEVDSKVYEERVAEPDFSKEFHQIIEECWSGTQEEDERERNRYRSLATAALKTLGYEVEISDQVLKAILV